jgi:site-specific DNA recombinase
VLLVYRVDRFFRNLSDMVTLLDELEECGVAFRSATEPFDTATPDGADAGADARYVRPIRARHHHRPRDQWDGTQARQRKMEGRETALRLPRGQDHRHPDPDESEAVIVRLIFDLYTRDRLGTRSIAKVLNDRDHPTTTSGRWSGHQVLRALNNRVYLGELSFREATKTGTHPALITAETWEKAQAILDARGESHAHRASSGSDYVPTGRLRCPKCGKAMIGTRATGRNKTYR